MPVGDVLILLVVGLAAGLLGGLLGIGGSIVLIPVLSLLLDKSQHLAQASAMIVNVCVAAPSALNHHRAGVVRWDVLTRMLPAGIILILVGVFISDLFTRESEDVLKRIFGIFLVYVVVMNILEIAKRNGRSRDESVPAQVVSWSRCSSVGGVTGFLGGLLGIGGGVIAVPLLQRVCRLPLRQCIGTSSAAIVLTALVGAITKNITLPTHVDAAGEAIRISDSLIIAAVLAPTAIVGGLIGAKLTHVLPLAWVRAVLLVLLSVAAMRLIGYWPW